MDKFGSRKLMKETLKHANSKTKMVICPKCGTRMTVTFLTPNDTATCRNCGTKIYQ